MDWMQEMETCRQQVEEQLYAQLADSDGKDSVCIYCAAERAVRKLPPNRNVQIDRDLIERLRKIYGEENIKIVEKSIDNRRKMN